MAEYSFKNGKLSYLYKTEKLKCLGKPVKIDFLRLSPKILKISTPMDYFRDSYK